MPRSIVTAVPRGYPEASLRSATRSGSSSLRSEAAVTCDRCPSRVPRSLASLGDPLGLLLASLGGRGQFSSLRRFSCSANIGLRRANTSSGVKSS